MRATVPLAKPCKVREIQSTRDCSGLEVSTGTPVEAYGRLDIIVVNYETPGLLDDCLRSITSHSGIGQFATGRGGEGVREVIVVDNSPTPEGAELIVRKHPAVVLLRSETNIGYGSAANRGIAAGAGEYALVLNADAQLHAGAVEALIEELDLHPDTGIVGPRLVDAEGHVQPSCARFPTPGRVFLHETGLWKLIRSTTVGKRARPFFDLDAPGVAPWVLGAALAIRRRSFDAVGGFDPQYFMYYEEVDLCRRLAATGTLTRFTPAATISHIGGASTMLNRLPMQLEMFRSLARYIRRHGRDPGLVRLRLAVVAIASAWFWRDVLTRSGGQVRVRLRQSARGWRAIVSDAMVGWSR
jgi:N-acetylglucosaminyl-diphospho-decaprenol L-rhamnosyltransferase